MQLNIGFHRWSQLLVALFVFLMFFLIGLETPFHSDDFRLAQLTDIQGHKDLYFGWTGRVVAHAFSTAILSINNKIIISAIISCFSTGLCILIAAIPNALSEEKTKWNKILFISAIYWISHPNLGQANFWVVGACNYTVTTFFVALTVYLIVRCREQALGWKTFLLILVALLAGCSNENVSITLIYTLIVIYISFIWNKIKFNKELFVLIISGSIIGALVLILAPGNFQRYAAGMFSGWRELSLLEKAIAHSYRIAWFFVLCKIAFLIWYVFFAESVFFAKVMNIEGIRRNITLTLIALSSALVASFIMVCSPYMPPRSYSGIFFFFLLSLSFLLENNQYYSGFIRRFNICILAGCAIIWSSSFVLMYSSYSVTTKQEKLRNDHIQYEKTINGSNVVVYIPSYYFINLQSEGEKFDMYHSEYQASWFGVKDVKVAWVNYDYSVLTEGKEVAVVNKTSLSDVKAYYRPKSFLYPTSSLLIETSSKIDSNLRIKIIFANQGAGTTYVLTSPIKLKDKYYIGISKSLREISGVEVLN